MMQLDLLLLLSLSLHNSVAQEKAYSLIQASWGIGYIMRQDLSFSRMIHKKLTPHNFSLLYERSNRLDQK